MELQLQIGIDDHAEGHDARRSRQTQRGQAPQADVDRIDPQHIVGIRRSAAETELRAHDAGDDDDSERVVLDGRGCCLACESRQIPVFSRSEVVDQLTPQFSTDQQPLNILVAQCEAVVRGDVIEWQVCAAHAGEVVAGPIHRVMARSEAAPLQRPAPCCHRRAATPAGRSARRQRGASFHATLRAVHRARTSRSAPVR